MEKNTSGFLLKNNVERDKLGDTDIAGNTELRRIIQKKKALTRMAEEPEYEGAHDRELTN
jgi:hypothetical protein